MTAIVTPVQLQNNGLTIFLGPLMGTIRITEFPPWWLIPDKLNISEDILFKLFKNRFIGKNTIISY